MVERAREARTSGIAADSPEARAVVGRWIELSARAIGRADDPEFARWFLDHVTETHDPRLSRYWQLIGVIKNWPLDWEQQADWDWIMSTVRLIEP